MSLEKSKVKLGAYDDVGARLGKAMTGAREEVLRHEAGNQALLQGRKAVEALMGHVDKDVDEEKYGLEVAAEIKRYVQRAMGLLDNLAQAAANNRIAAVGKVQAMGTSLEVVKRLYEGEESKLAGQLLVVENADGTVTDIADARARVVGTRPPAGIKQQRLAEEAAEAAAAPKPESPEPEPENDGQNS